MTAATYLDHSEDGFTLVELLVALALLAVIASFALGSVNTFESMSRVAADLDNEAQVSAVARHLGQTLADARAIPLAVGNGAPRLAFSGGRESIKLVTVLNDSIERGGLYVLDYGISAGGGDLVLRRQMLRPAAADGQALERVLLKGIESLDLHYCAGVCGGDPLAWPQVWTDPDKLPGRIAVAISFPEGDRRTWPLLIVSVAEAQ